MSLSGSSVSSRPPTPVRDVLFRPIHFIETATNNYVTNEDQVVSLRVNGQLFKVSKNRLMLRSPVFRDMFGLTKESLPEGKSLDCDRTLHERNGVLPKINHDQEEEQEVVELHNEPEDFKHFLWYIHADPLAAHEFAEAEPTPKKCMILLGIASIAHMYEALDVANWTMRTVLGILMQIDRPFSVDSKLATHLLRTASRFQETITHDFLKNARDVVCDAMHTERSGTLSTDPIAAVRVAQEVDDTYVLGHAYFYTLEKGNDYWRNDARLRAYDRRRLVCGGFLLLQRKLNGGNQYHHNQPRTPVQIWNGHKYVWQNPVWEPLVHPEIWDLRNELWALFDCEPWRLVEEISQSPSR